MFSTLNPNSEYSGREVPMRYTHTQLEPSALASACKKYLASSKNEIMTVGLAPFCANNPAPTVSFITKCIYILIQDQLYIVRLDILTICLISRQPTHGGSPLKSLVFKRRQVLTT